MSGGLRPRHVKGNTVLDRILKAFLKNNLDGLSHDDKFVLERITEVDNRIRCGYVVKKTKYDHDLQVDVEDYRYTRPYRKSELAEWQVARFNISLAQAYKDIEMAERFFLTTEKRPDKEFARGQMIYWGEDAMAEARAMGDFRSAAALFKVVALIRGLDKEEEPGFDPEKFKPIQPEIVVDPSELGFDKIDNPDNLVARLNKELRKTKLMDRLIQAEAEDAEIEEEEDDE